MPSLAIAFIVQRREVDKGSVAPLGSCACMLKRIVIMPPTLKKLEGRIALGLSVCSLKI